MENLVKKECNCLFENLYRDFTQNFTFRTDERGKEMGNSLVLYRPRNMSAHLELDNLQGSDRNLAVLDGGAWTGEYNNSHCR